MSDEKDSGKGGGSREGASALQEVFGRVGDLSQCPALGDAGLTQYVAENLA